MPILECPKDECDWSTAVNYTDHPSGSYNQAFRLAHKRYQEHCKSQHDGRWEGTITLKEADNGESNRGAKRDSDSGRIQSSPTSTQAETSETTD